MCFSANASFGLGAALLVVGFSSARKAVSITQIPFAFIPLFFAIQQFIEGFLWLSLTKVSWEDWHLPMTYLFLVFAQILWPIWVPMSMLLIEKQINRKRILLSLTGFGLMVSVYVFYALITYQVDSHIRGHHIVYDLYFPDDIISLSGVFYFLPTVAPAFVSAVKSMIYLAIALLLSFIVTKLFFQEYIVSVWCYFAAAISVVVVIVMTTIQKHDQKSVVVNDIRTEL